MFTRFKLWLFLSGCKTQGYSMRHGARTPAASTCAARSSSRTAAAIPRHVIVPTNQTTQFPSRSNGVKADSKANLSVCIDSELAWRVHPHSAMSSRRGGVTRGAPAHQNKTAWKHNPKSSKTAAILASPISGLCQRCHATLEWRKQYRKYKPLTSLKKCVWCEQKTINKAYHVVCDPCAKSKKVCAKCLLERDVVSKYAFRSSMWCANLLRNSGIR